MTNLDLTKLTRLLHGEAVAEGAIRREDVHAMAAGLGTGAGGAPSVVRVHSDERLAP